MVNSSAGCFSDSRWFCHQIDKLAIIDQSMQSNVLVACSFERFPIEITGYDQVYLQCEEKNFRLIWKFEMLSCSIDAKVSQFNSGFFAGSTFDAH